MRADFRLQIECITLRVADFFPLQSVMLKTCRLAINSRIHGSFWEGQCRLLVSSAARWLWVAASLPDIQPPTPRARLGGAIENQTPENWTLSKRREGQRTEAFK